MVFSVKCVSRKFQNLTEVLFCNFLLSWISLQLPEQKEDLFFDQRFFLTFFHTLNFLDSKFVGTQIFFTLILFQTQNLYGLKFYSHPQFFMDPGFIVDPNYFLWSHFFSRPKFFLTQNSYGPKFL